MTTMEFEELCKTHGMAPSKPLRDFVEAALAQERAACCRIVTGLCISDNNAREINDAIKARGNNERPQAAC